MRIILSLFFFAAVFAHSEENAEQQYWKTIEIEWEQVPNAVSYEVRLSPVTGDKPHIFSTSDNHLSQQVPVGNYRLQIRSKAKDTGDFSPWSAASDFEVVNKEVEPLSPKNNEVINAATDRKQTIDFNWSPVDKVKQYTLKVWNDDRKDNPWIFTGTSTHRRLEVPVGRVYFWQVLFASASDVDYAQEPKTFSFSIQGKPLLKPAISKYVPGKDLSWKGGEGTAAYKVKIFSRLLDEKDWHFKREEKTENPHLVLKLDPGNAKVEVTATAPKRIDSEAATYEFLVKPTLVQLNTALSKAVHQK